MEIPKSLVIFCLLLTHVNIAFSAETAQALVQDTTLNKTRHNNIAEDDKKLLLNGKIDFYQSDNTTNEIPYFDNRFRIDAELDEITLVFFRERGSTPVILVQPDGKKIRANDYDHEKVKWHDDRTFDMIKISKPMPGPWQAIGDILPDSKILVVSDVSIAVDPLPEVVLSGETLKVVGRLYNGNQKIDVLGFKDTVQLDVNFFSTNNSAYDNFGRDGFKLTSFEDNGRDLDEYAGDGLYTGEFVLDFATGEWQPVFIIKLPLITRELRQKPILLYQSPITLTVETSNEESSPHNLLITIDPTYVDPSSLVFQGKTTFPDRQTKPFSIINNESNEDAITRTQIIPYTEPGIHRVNLSAFGRTTTGREFRLVVPEFTFNVKGSLNKTLKTTTEEIDGDQALIVDTSIQDLADKNRKMLEDIAEQKKIKEEDKTQTILLIAAGNGIIILIALAIFLVMRKRKLKQ
ncbi:TIGR03503 family protein [Colwellia sp. MSW7]|uniref:TIGR03503 family protein n=1 Tax=Colwellia maritima TaxID=2912588 RepID=A0ABS9X2Y4_9GAMM|nr:TIGR03503 family protein [Colwellia maritima]MCI2284560.1 TIGR03503 family protein [Colwellia maritima]